MKSPKPAAPTNDVPDDAPAMPIPPHGGSFVLDEEANTLTHVLLPVSKPDAVEGGGEQPPNSDPEEAN